MLKWIRIQPELATLRVVILTSSDETRDVSAAYQLGANSFLIKPLDFERFVEFSQAMGGYWLWSNEVPESSQAPEKNLLSEVEIRRRPSRF